MAGEGPTPLLTPNSGCDYLGFVPDAPGPGGLDALYQDCDLACAPLFSGSGTSIKVLEALGRGLPCLATPWAARHLDTGSAILRVREPEAWSDELVEMLHARRRLGARARRAAPEVRQSYGIQRFQGAVDQLLQLVRETVVG
jgi:glycosyltransferase involved in cell wall biosynthesis